MANDQTAKALTRVFELAVMQREAEKLSGQQWEVYQKISIQAEQHRREEKQDFKINYETRLQTEKQRLIDKAGEKNLEYKPNWAKHNKWNPETLDRQARINLKREHQDRLQQIDAVEHKSLKTLLDGAKLKRRSSYDNVKSLDEKFNEKAERRQRHIH